ncbi:hypothetical protein [Ancylobacter oerskovii]|uniref:Class I SAM-dependent methyltransferase n=1 Tax=Ancylobacter oerskovii TaxID=459519 RepID=A0ABW4Z4R1_9HYPH|nr:hypothetical protein [Ancylobacter oerskovii]MBS7543216.1 hypothetical protein [Ancylobacter oerskovii]
MVSEDVVQNSEKESVLIKVPSRPNLPNEVVEFLGGQFKDINCYLEYGAGGGARMAARAGVSHIYSVEADEDIVRSVRKALKQDLKRNSATVVNANIGETAKWGFPVGTDSCRLWPNYPISVWDRMEQADVSPGLVLIDGRFRVACFLITMLRGLPGTSIIFDDFVSREARYKLVEKYAAPERVIGRAAVFVVPEERSLVELSMDFARACVDPR